MTADEIQSVGVVGAGTMGAGIAHVAAQAGYTVLLFDATDNATARAKEQIAADLAKGVEKGKVTPEARDAALARIHATRALVDFTTCQLVIEAVPEDLEIKRRLFTDLSRICPPAAILASNTSSLSLTEIAAAATHPERVVGMHFFNPVHRMALLELVSAHQTSEQTLATARAVGERLGKQTIAVRDSPGFASSRLGIALGMEAIRMLEEGVATAADIDRAMKLGYGHPMGPLELTDLVGLDVRLAIAEHLHRELGSPTFRPPQLLKRMVRAGMLGKKSGQGFYEY